MTSALNLPVEQWQASRFQFQEFELSEKQKREVTQIKFSTDISKKPTFNNRKRARKHETHSIF